METNNTKIRSLVDHLELVSRGGRQQLISLGNFDDHLREISGAIMTSSTGIEERAAAKGFLLRSIGSENKFLSSVADEIVRMLTRKDGSEEARPLDHSTMMLLSTARRALETKIHEVSMRKEELEAKVKIIDKSVDKSIDSDEELLRIDSGEV
jgi:hypothetical protein